MLCKKQDIVRKDLTSNILKKVILRIDFLRILKIEELVSSVQEYLSTKQFFLMDETILNDINVELKINDPDDNIIKKHVKHKKIYIFKNNTSELIIAENFISFNVNCETNYNFETCINIFSNIVLNAQKIFNFIKFTRIGIRKINNVVCKCENLYSCFDENFFKNLILDTSNIIEWNKRTSLDNFDYNNHSFNVSKLIQKGFIEDNEKNDISAFSVILDIDGYLKNDINLGNFKSEKNIKDIINNINEDIFKIFKSMLTVNFINNLIHGYSDKIEWGINNND